MPEALSLTAIERRYADGTQALLGVDLDLRRGEFVTIVGPSGCGKSTLLRIAAGLDRPTGGTVRTAGGRVGFVFQEPALLPWRTALGNVELAAELAGVPVAERRALARQELERVGLSEFGDRLPHQLSGGMKMRVSVARALVLRPELFLFDEPFGALDEITRQALQVETAALFTRERFAGLLVTHSVAEAVLLSTRVVVMSRRPGRLVASFDVDLPFPREADQRFTPRFSELARAVSAALSAAAA